MIIYLIVQSCTYILVQSLKRMAFVFCTYVYLLILVHSAHSLLLASSLTGLSTCHPNHPGPGDADRALPACDCKAPGWRELPVFPQRLITALLPLQGSSCPIRNSSCQCLFPPEVLHWEHHEVSWLLWFLCLKGCMLTQQRHFQEWGDWYSSVTFSYSIYLLSFQGVPWSSSSEPHAAGAQAAEKLPAPTWNLCQQWCRFFEESSLSQRKSHSSNKWRICTHGPHSMCIITETLQN